MKPLILPLIGLLAFVGIAVIDRTSLAADAPQAQAETKTLTQRRVQWVLDRTVGAYDAVGNKDPRWDKPAHVALNAAARAWGDSPRRDFNDNVAMGEGAEAAIKAGCDDPLVLHMRSRALVQYRAKRSDVLAMEKRAIEAFRHSRYPADQRVTALLHAAELEALVAPGDEQARRDARADVDEAFKLLPELLADAKIPPAEIVDLLALSIDASEAVEGDPQVIGNRVIAVMQKASVSKSLIMTGVGAAVVRSAEGAGELVVVRHYWEQAWKLDETNVEAACLMLSGETVNSHGREVMETWFQRAVKLDPDDPRPYHAKLNWLEPKWHGSVEEMLAFGRECAKGGRWNALVPMLLVDAHWGIGYYGGADYPDSPHREYFAKSLEVWNEIKPVYDRYMQEPEPSVFHKTRYAVIAAYSGKWKEADALFKSLGKDHPSPVVLYDGGAMDALVKEAAKKAADPENNGGGKSPLPKQ